MKYYGTDIAPGSSLDVSPERWPGVLQLVAHQLRTPTGLVAGYTEMLADDRIQADPSRRHQILDEIRQNLGDLNRLATQLQEGSRAAAGALPIRRRRLALRPLIEESLRSAAPLCELRSVDLESKPVGEVAGHLIGDRYYLKLCLVNLIENAAKYGKPGGRVQVVVEPLAGMIELRVADEGTGLGRNASHLFAPFVQGASKGGGVGLGLTLVKVIVEAHGGSMAWRSERGGSYVGFRLPRSGN